MSSLAELGDLASVSFSSFSAGMEQKFPYQFKVQIG